MNNKEILIQFLDKSIEENKVIAIEYFNNIENKNSFEIADTKKKKILLKSYIVENFDIFLLYKNCKCLKIVNFYLLEIIEEGFKWLL